MKILFVCHGNICRSPMAEFVMKDLVRRARVAGVSAESAALHSDAVGCDIHGGTRRKLREMSVPFEPREAWLLTAEKASGYDLIVGMDGYNMDDLECLLPPSFAGRTAKLLSFAGSSRDVADPWYTGDFDTAYDDILEGCTALLAKIGNGGSANG